MTPLHAAGYALLGLAVGAFGTLIGAGGGWLLAPILAFLDPHEPASSLTAISLAIVCLNAASGSIAYGRMRRIDARAALAFSAAGLPGSILGAWATRFIDRRVFDPPLGITLIVGAVAVLARREGPVRTAPDRAVRTLVERDGTAHTYAPRMRLGMALSAGVGFLSSLLGIGGGIIHVPTMVVLLGFPTHIATATSHAALAILSLAGVIVHVADGTLRHGLVRIAPLALGVLPGAQLGARLSSWLRGRWILWSLAVALIAVGARLLFAR